MSSHSSLTFLSRTSKLTFDFFYRWVYIIASVGIAVSLYYVFRVLPVQRKRRTQNVSQGETKEKK